MRNERAISNYCKGKKLQTGMMLTFRQMPNGEQKPDEVEQSNLCSALALLSAENLDRSIWRYVMEKSSGPLPAPTRRRVQTHNGQGWFLRLALNIGDSRRRFT